MRVLIVIFLFMFSSCKKEISKKEIVKEVHYSEDDEATANRVFSGGFYFCIDSSTGYYKIIIPK